MCVSKIKEIHTRVTEFCSGSENETSGCVMEKRTINLPFWIIFQRLLSENWSFVTYITNLERIHEKTFQVIVPPKKWLCRTLIAIAIFLN